jgi:DNA-binding NarL/FixJ family response regulator
VTAPARVLLADDHVVVRRGLRLVLDAEPDLRVVAEAGDGRAAVAQATVEGVDLAILDVSMPNMSGIEAAAELASRQPSVRTLILSMHAHPSLLHEALRAGASGYVLKSSADRELVGACRAALRDEPFVYPEGLEDTMRGYVGRSWPTPARPTRSPWSSASARVPSSATARTSWPSSACATASS